MRMMMRQLFQRLGMNLVKKQFFMRWNIMNLSIMNAVVAVDITTTMNTIMNIITTTSTIITITENMNIIMNVAVDADAAITMTSIIITITTMQMKCSQAGAGKLLTNIQRQNWISL